MIEFWVRWTKKASFKLTKQDQIMEIETHFVS